MKIEQHNAAANTITTASVRLVGCIVAVEALGCGGAPLVAAAQRKDEQLRRERLWLRRGRRRSRRVIL